MTQAEANDKERRIETRLKISIIRWWIGNWHCENEWCFMLLRYRFRRLDIRFI